MTHDKPAILAAIALTTGALLFPGLLPAGQETHEHRAVIALKTDDFGLVETDVSDLAPGESRSVVTDSGSHIDILRTEHGFEVYLDGALIEPGLTDVSGAAHETIKTVEVHCDDEGECGQSVWIEAETDSSYAEGESSGETRIIQRIIHVECDGADACEEEIHQISGDDGADLHVIRLHEDTPGHSADSEHQTIVIKKKDRSD